ncbi:hypothetical protein A2459_00210 [Candidatus Roizmanbacteria bacterium RIFOXYC2_FULL_41_10]|nr:MAG: hypothetical protein A2459_00210 [Candidatus Roizmanbacteria bacterium RIFOXYC2_FULL_41_10]
MWIIRVDEIKENKLNEEKKTLLNKYGITQLSYYDGSLSSEITTYIDALVKLEDNWSEYNCQYKFPPTPTPLEDKFFNIDWSEYTPGSIKSEFNNLCMKIQSNRIAILALNNELPLIRELVNDLKELDKPEYIKFADQIQESINYFNKVTYSYIATPEGLDFKIPNSTIVAIENLLANDSQEIIKTTRMYFNSKRLLFVETIGIGCASCHQRWLYLFDLKGNKLWETTSDDGVLGGFTNNNFYIVEPIRSNDRLFSEFKGRYFKLIDGKIVEIE